MRLKNTITSSSHGTRCWTTAVRRLVSDSGRLRRSSEAELAAHAILNGLAEVRVLFEEVLDVLAALAETLAGKREPRAARLDDLVPHVQIDQVAFARDAFAVHHVELRFAERGSHLVLDDLDARASADDRLAVLDRTNASNVDANRCVELERAATRCGFGIAEHDADLFA